jgi:hypothetical protein
MDDDSDLEDYNLTQTDSGILPRTPAEEACMVDDNDDQDMSVFEVPRYRNGWFPVYLAIHLQALHTPRTAP